MKAHLNPTDLVGVSFWIISAAMLAATFFFGSKEIELKTHGKPLSVAAMVTGIAALHYFYMREFWLIKGGEPNRFKIRRLDSHGTPTNS